MKAVNNRNRTIFILYSRRMPFYINTFLVYMRRQVYDLRFLDILNKRPAYMHIHVHAYAYPYTRIHTKIQLRVFMHIRVHPVLYTDMVKLYLYNTYSFYN